MREEHESFIENEFRECVERTIDRLGSEDTHRPFHAALLSEQALFWSRFERSFSTSFGQRVIEQVSRIAAEAGGAQIAQTQKETTVTLSSAKLAAIEEHMAGLRAGRNLATPDWESTLAELATIRPEREMQTIRVISDLWWQRGGINHYMSIKTVKPNIDQTAEAKRDMLKLKLADPKAEVYFGLYYNPYGVNRADYAWSPPQRIFNMATDRSVLIGKDYWDALGGAGFYEELLAVAERVGRQTRKRIGALR
ncbi:MAG: TdeIII family type II restriction endonuclease [Proteobacteria bacterium]|nr:TdeIII family type II restriction endonuclease [Pseudomonadota bacterium]MBS0462861.1 TdeIII family type II restriction endonuclease [Pseudomonadota bacterium]MBS0463603.1 TdeIII family type II restriction endonuclease [Pseudomonadota bacterium]